VLKTMIRDSAASESGRKNHESCGFRGGCARPGDRREAAAHGADLKKGKYRNIRAALAGNRRLVAVSRSTCVWGEETDGGTYAVPIDFVDAPPLTRARWSAAGQRCGPVLYETVPVAIAVDARDRVIG